MNVKLCLTVNRAYSYTCYIRTYTRVIYVLIHVLCTYSYTCYIRTHTRVIYVLIHVLYTYSYTCYVRTHTRVIYVLIRVIYVLIHVLCTYSYTCYIRTHTRVIYVLIHVLYMYSYTCYIRTHTRVIYVLIHVLYTCLRTVMQKKTCTHYTKLVSHRYVFKPLFIYGAVWIGKIIKNKDCFNKHNRMTKHPPENYFFSCLCFLCYNVQPMPK
jgi:hypothetical protein